MVLRRTWAEAAEKIRRVLPSTQAGMLITLGTIGALLRIVLLFASHGVAWPDTALYYRTAERLLQHHTYSGHPIFHGPIYPLFLALFLSLRDSEVIGLSFVIAQHLIGLASVFLMYFLVRDLFGAKLAAVAALLTACSPLLLYYETVAQTETLFAFSLAAFLLMFVRAMKSQRSSDAACSGLLCALAILVRPVAQLLPFCLAPFLIFGATSRKTGGRLSIVFLLWVFIGAFPWMYTNYREYGFFGVSKGGGLNLYLRVFDLDHLSPSGPSQFADVEWARRFYRAQTGHSYYLVEKKLGEEFHESAPEIDDRMLGYALETVRSHRLSFALYFVRDFVSFFVAAHDSISLCPSSAGPFLCSPRLSTNKVVGPFRANLVSRSRRFNHLIFHYFENRYPMLLISVLTLIGMVAWLFSERAKPRNEYWSGGALLAAILYFASFSVLLNKPEDRYRLPVDPIIFAFAAYGAAEMYRVIRESGSTDNGKWKLRPPPHKVTRADLKKVA